MHGGKRVSTLAVLSITTLASMAPVALAQREGLSGVPAKLPNVLGRDRSLPIQRQITLPGVTPPAPGDPGVVPIPAVVGYPRPIYTTSNGVEIDASYDGDKLSLDLHIGTDAGALLRRTGDYRLVVGPDGRYYYAPRGHYYPTWYVRRGSYYSSYGVDGAGYRAPDPSLTATPRPAPAPAEQMRELTSIERARLAHRLDELEIAIKAYREHLEEDPEDVKAMRHLGLALIEGGDFEDGIAMIGLAYHTDPLLARDAADLESVGLVHRRFDTLLGRAMSLARRTESGRAWLPGIVLLQADGKMAGAGRLLDRAEAAGLEGEVLEALDREIGLPARQRP